MSLISGMWGVGQIAGPALGGLLVAPRTADAVRVGPNPNPNPNPNQLNTVPSAPPAATSLRHPVPMTQLLRMADKRLYLSTSRDGVVALWDVASLKPLRTLKATLTLTLSLSLTLTPTLKAPLTPTLTLTPPLTLTLTQTRTLKATAASGLASWPMSAAHLPSLSSLVLGCGDRSLPNPRR